VFAIDGILVAREAARGGLGIAELPDYLARDGGAPYFVRIIEQPARLDDVRPISARARGDGAGAPTA